MLNKKDGAIKGTVSFILPYCEEIGLNFTTIIFKAEAVSIR